MKVLITGARGNLGTELIRQLSGLGIEYVATDKFDADICNPDAIYQTMLYSDPTHVIHCAAIADVPGCEVDKTQAYNVNVNGTMNVARACRDLNKTLIHISTDYVFKGDKPYEGDGKEGNYNIEDPLSPINYYSFTKAAAEVVVQSVVPSDKLLIVRTSFCPKGSWLYPKAFVDQYTSRDTIDVVAEQILKAVQQERSGIVHLGTERKSVYGLAKRLSPEVQPMSRRDIKNVVLPEDTSLRLTEL